jgi:hypothetical protein
MPVWLIRTVLPNVSGLARDQVVNDFVFNEPSSEVAAVAAVKSFWTGDHTGGAAAPLAAFINQTMSRTVNVQVEAYALDGHLDGSPHGSPDLTDAFALTAFSGNALPDPMCGVLSYHADFGSALETGPAVTTIPTDARARKEGAPAVHAGRTRPKSSLRGRLYIGPLTVASINPLGVVSAGFAQSMAGSGEFLAGAALGWCVWSRRTASVHNIVAGWTDDELGVQRRHQTDTRGKTPWVPV